MNFTGGYVIEPPSTALSPAEQAALDAETNSFLGGYSNTPQSAPLGAFSPHANPQEFGHEFGPGGFVGGNVGQGRSDIGLNDLVEGLGGLFGSTHSNTTAGQEVKEASQPFANPYTGQIGYSIASKDLSPVARSMVPASVYGFPAEIDAMNRAFEPVDFSKDRSNLGGPKGAPAIAGLAKDTPPPPAPNPMGSRGLPTGRFSTRNDPYSPKAPEQIAFRGVPLPEPNAIAGRGKGTSRFNTNINPYSMVPTPHPNPQHEMALQAIASHPGRNPSRGPITDIGPGLPSPNPGRTAPPGLPVGPDPEPQGPPAGPGVGGFAQQGIGNAVPAGPGVAGFAQPGVAPTPMGTADLALGPHAGYGPTARDVPSMPNMAGLPPSNTPPAGPGVGGFAQPGVAPQSVPGMPGMVGIPDVTGPPVSVEVGPEVVDEDYAHPDIGPVETGLAYADALAAPNTYSTASAGPDVSARSAQSMPPDFGAPPGYDVVAPAPGTGLQEPGPLTGQPAMPGTVSIETPGLPTMQSHGFMGHMDPVNSNANALAGYRGGVAFGNIPAPQPFSAQELSQAQKDLQGWANNELAQQQTDRGGRVGRGTQMPSMPDVVDRAGLSNAGLFGPAEYGMNTPGWGAFEAPSIAPASMGIPGTTVDYSNEPNTAGLGGFAGPAPGLGGVGGFAAPDLGYSGIGYDPGLGENIGGGWGGPSTGPGDNLGAAPDVTTGDIAAAMGGRGGEEVSGIDADDHMGDTGVGVGGGMSDAAASEAGIGGGGGGGGGADFSDFAGFDSGFSDGGFDGTGGEGVGTADW